MLIKKKISNRTLLFSIVTRGQNYFFSLNNRSRYSLFPRFSLALLINCKKYKTTNQLLQHSKHFQPKRTLIP